MVSDDRLFLERRQIKNVSSPFALYFQNAFFFFITKNGSDEKTKKHQSGSTSNKKVKS